MVVLLPRPILGALRTTALEPELHMAPLSGSAAFAAAAASEAADVGTDGDATG